MAQIICLANSRKHGNRCIAGIDLADGRLVRPVSSLYDGAITVDMQRVEGEIPQVLDVLEISLRDNGPDYGFQPENRLLGNEKWKQTGRVASEDILKYCESGPTILHNALDHVPWNHLQSLPPSQWKSLQFVRVTDARFHETPSARGVLQVRAQFSYGDSSYDLVVTDSLAEQAVRASRPIGADCALLISLGGPFPEDAPAPQCYKLVAGVIEIGSRSDRLR